MIEGQILQYGGDQGMVIVMNDGCQVHDVK